MDWKINVMNTILLFIGWAVGGIAIFVINLVLGNNDPMLIVRWSLLGAIIALSFGTISIIIDAIWYSENKCTHEGSK